jgi:hypothetical protein
VLEWLGVGELVQLNLFLHLPNSWIHVACVEKASVDFSSHASASSVMELCNVRVSPGRSVDPSEKTGAGSELVHDPK